VINASDEFRKLVSDSSKVSVKADLTLADGTELALGGDDFMMGGMSFDDEVSSSSSFDIGAAIMGQCTLTLNNYDERFSAYDFTGAVVRPYVGVGLASGTVEWVQKGVYRLEQPDSYPSTVTLTCLDNLSLFETPYSQVSTRYPATLRTIAMDVCTKHGVTLADTDFANSTYSVPERPEDEALTCLEVIAYVAQASGCFARCDNRGRLCFDWYDLAAFEGESWLDGMVFDDATPYATGSKAEGGNFVTYSQGSVAEGGSFAQRSYAVIHAISSATVCTDDVVVTGVRVTEGDLEPEEGDTVPGKRCLYGYEGYVLAVEGNPLIPYGKGEEVAQRIGPRITGMRFRPFSASVVGDPCLEAGDGAIVIDGRQRAYVTYLTSCKYKAGGYQSLACTAETPSRNSATGYSAATKAIVAVRNEVKRERTAREQALKDLADTLGADNGMHVTTEQGASGGTICYIHDKPTIEESSVVWKMTADAIGISNDGGKTYPYGLTASGTAILERIYTIGLDADYITTGALRIKKDGQLMFEADVDTGDVYINGAAVTIGAESLDTVLARRNTVYCTCDSAASEASKQIVIAGGRPEVGDMLLVKFTNGNTAPNPSVSINGGYLYVPIFEGKLLGDERYYAWGKGTTVTFIYVGKQMVKMNNAYRQLDCLQLVDDDSFAQVKVVEDQISLKVSKGEVSSQLSIESGKVHIDSDRFSWDSTNSTLADDGTITSKASSGDLTISGGHLAFNKHGKPDEVTGVLQMENNGGAMRLLCRDGVMQLSGKEIQLYPTGRLSVNGQLGYTGNVFVDGKNLYFYKGILTTVDGNVSTT